MDEEEMMRQAALQGAANEGRGTDTTLAHLTLGEVVIPREMMEDPEVAQVIGSVFQAYGVDLREYTVGDPANKINPETGYPEFFFGKIFKSVGKIFKKVAPIALPILGSLIPGVGPVLGAALGGAAGGAISGGGIKGALTGGALGGLGGYLTGGASGLIGHAAGTPLSAVSGNALLQGPTQGSGLLGAATSGLSSVKNALGSGGLSALTSGGGSGLSPLSALVNTGASLYSGNKDDKALEEAQRAMLEAQGRASAQLQPYSQIGLDAQKQLSGNLTAGFDPGDLSQDPGYQFRLNQGMDALNTSLAAQGLGQSGGALKALEDYRQNFAANEYSSAYDRWLAQNSQLAGLGGQGLSTAGALGGIATDTGNTQAAYGLAAREAKNKRLAEILAGLGFK